jgi:hypothetical protein
MLQPRKLPSPNDVLGQSNKLPSPSDILKKKGSSELNTPQPQQTSTTVSPSADGSLATPPPTKEDDEIGALDDLWNTFKGAGAKALSNIASIPRFAQNAAMDLVLTVSGDSEKFNKLPSTLKKEIRNSMMGPILSTKPSQEATDYLNKKSEEIYKKTRQEEVDAVDELIKFKDNPNAESIQKILYQGLKTTVESVPNMFIGAVSLPTLGAVAAAGKRAEDIEETGDVGIGDLLNAGVYGSSEAVFEGVTNKILGKAAKSAIGNKKAAEAVAEGFVKSVLKDFGKEGFSEGATTLVQEISDKITKGEDIDFYNLSKQVANSTILGGISGGGISAAGSSIGKIRNATKYVAGKITSKEDINKINNNIKTIQSLNLEKGDDVDSKINDIVDKKINQLTEENNSIIQKNEDIALSLSENQIKQVFDIDNQLENNYNSAKSIIDNESMDDESKKLLLDDLLKEQNDLKQEKENIKNEKLREDAVQKQTTDESVLRTEQPEVGLQGMVEGNAQPEGVTQESIITEKPEEVTPIVEQTFKDKTDSDLEKRMSEIEDKYNGIPSFSINEVANREYNQLEKEMEKRERDSVFNVPLEEVNNAVDNLIKKEKEMPNGYGSFIEKRDASDTKEVANKYLEPKKITDSELSKDFVDGLMGNPTTWYADGLKVRESLKEGINRGKNINEFIDKAIEVYTKDGYSEKEARKVVSGMVQKILKGAEEISEATPVVKEVTPEVKANVEEVFNSNPKLAEIGTSKEYSEYIDSVFPESKVKDIVYHGSPEKFKGDFFDKIERGKRQPTESFHFTTHKSWAVKNYAKGNSENVLSVILDIKNPIITDRGSAVATEAKTAFPNNDGVLTEYPDLDLASRSRLEEIVVFEPEQIHILGSEKDIQGFKQFINKTTEPKLETAEKSKSIDEAIKTLQESKEYIEADDIQKEKLVRATRKEFGLKEKAAPSVNRLFGKLKDIAKVTMTEKAGLVKQIKDTAKGARESVKAFKLASQQLTKDVKELKASGKITATQLTNILSTFSKVNVLNDASVSNFVDYMTKVFNDADYINKIDTAKSNLKTAKKNIVTKLGIDDGLIFDLQRLFSINPILIPDAYLGKYLSLVDMFGKKQAVLTLEEKSKTLKDVQEILDEINTERSLVDELADRFNNYEDKVFKNNKLDYSATLNKMLDEGEIDADGFELMKKYKKDILPQVEKSPLSEEEIQAEKEGLVEVIGKLKIDGSELSNKDDRRKSKELNALIKGKAVNELTNVELKNLLKVIDNINNGYFPHYAQLMIEKLNSINNDVVLENAIDKSKLPPISKLYAKAKSVLTRKDAVLEMVRRNPLFNIDQVLGDFKTKDIFNSLLSKAAEGEAKFTSELKNVQALLEKAEEKVAKSFKLEPNETLMSKFKMMTYMIQLEYNSNPNSKQVNPAAEYLKATIKHIEAGKSQFGERDAEMLQEILNQFAPDGEVDIDKLYNSFNNAEKEAIKTVRSINESLKEKAEHTAAIIRGQKINPLNNYVHLNVLHEYKPNDLASGESFANDYNNSMRPSTKAKSLIERTGKVSPLNFDIFTSAQRGAKFVLMDYHLTEPIRTARKTISRTISNMESKGKVSKEKRQIVNAINNALEESIENLVVNSYGETSFGDDVIDFISRQGYRSVLAGTGRFAAEFLSNVGFVLLSDPTAFTEGVKYTGTIMSADAPTIMNNVNSKETNRIFPTDTLSGRMIDTGILNQASGIKGAKSKNVVANKIQQIFNLSGKKYINSVELLSDILISTPDKAIMRPIWFGSFAYNFKKITGEDVDFEKIAANDEAYMDENKAAIEEAKTIADERSVITGASSNAFTGILKGTTRVNQSASIKAFNNFNNFMTKFMVYEFVTARTGIMAAMGNGSLTKKQGVALLAAAVTRMTVYSLLIKVFGEGIIGLLFDDEEEEEEKAPEKAVGQALASTFSSMLLGRDFGNVTKSLINYGVEQVNENYLDFLREGEYDPYKDALQYSTIPADKKGVQTGIYDFFKNMTGSYGPAIKTADLVLKKTFEDDKKQPEAIERQEKEKNIRIPLEVLGNLGLIPLYKEIRKSAMKDIYKGLEKGGSGITKEELKKSDPKMYRIMYGID